jgi:hypothetical protein
MNGLCKKSEISAVCHSLKIGDTDSLSWDVRFLLIAQNGINNSEKHSLNWLAYTALYDKHITPLIACFGSGVEALILSVVTNA